MELKNGMRVGPGGSVVKMHGSAQTLARIELTEKRLAWVLRTYNLPGVKSVEDIDRLMREEAEALTERQEKANRKQGK